MRLLRAILLLIVAWVAAALAASLVYVVVTYLEASRHTPVWPPRESIRTASRELAVATWTQMFLLPLRVFGRRLGTGGGEVPVVLVHGYAQNRVDMLWLARRLRAAGCGPVRAFNYAWWRPIEHSADAFDEFIGSVLEETGAVQVDLLAHSMGGLLALDVAPRRSGQVRRVVVVAMPGRGVTWPGPALGRAGEQLRATSGFMAGRASHASSVPVLSVYSSHDNLVHPASSSHVEGPCATNVEFDGLGHLSLLHDRGVADAIVTFLMAGTVPARCGGRTPARR